MSNTNIEDDRFEIVEESEEEKASTEFHRRKPEGSFELVEEIDMKALRIIRDNFEEVFKRVAWDCLNDKNVLLLV